MEISSKLMTLIDYSKDYLVIVSPYVNFSKWIKLKNCLERAVNRGIKIDFYIREDADIDEAQFKDFNITPIRIKNLHAKLYLSESKAIVTSQNIVYYSDINSLDIGYETETEAELEELKSFIEVYLKQDIVKPSGESNKVSLPNDIISTARQKPDIEKLAKGSIEYLLNEFKNRYPNSQIKNASTYLFSSQIIDFADIMVSGDLVFKYYDERFFQSDLLKSKKNPDTYHNFYIHSENNKSKTFYLSFIPEKIKDLEKLAKDYIAIVESLKNNKKYFFLCK